MKLVGFLPFVLLEKGGVTGYWGPPTPLPLQLKGYLRLKDCGYLRLKDCGTKKLKKTKQKKLKKKLKKKC